MNKKKAFTLIEVILGISILGVMLMAMTSLTITAIRANQANIHRLTAYYLAQEAIEGVRNMRDSNWLQNRTYDEGYEFWGSNFSEDGYYTLSYRPEADASYPSSWLLTYFGNDLDGGLEAAKSASLLNRVVYGDRPFYVHYSSADVDPTLYFRYLKIVHDPSGDWFEVTAVVSWQEHGRESQVEVSTELSDWRQGPI